MRLVIFGAGAIRGVIGARAFQNGHDVTLIARGAHLEAIRDNGLRLETPDETSVLPVPAVEHVEQASLRAGDTVLLAVKSQHTANALEALAAQDVPDLVVACAQNGVSNEPAALRYFRHVCGVVVMCPNVHVAPGVVRAHSAPVTGLLDVGTYPHGVHEAAERLSAAFAGSSFESVSRPDIMEWKHGKLLSNLSNAIEAVCDSPASRTGAVARLVKDEALACFAAAGIARREEEPGSDRLHRVEPRPIGAQQRPGGSVWQSLRRGAGSAEVDFLNGEIVRLGREHAVATPVNELLQRLVNRMVRHDLRAGSMTEQELHVQALAAQV